MTDTPSRPHGEPGQFPHPTLYGYALTGHKAQGITVDRTFVVVGGGTSREWAYVAMSRGRESNRAYLLSLNADEQCAHLTHQGRGDPLEVAISCLQRRERRDAAFELGIGL